VLTRDLVVGRGTGELVEAVVSTQHHEVALLRRLGRAQRAIPHLDVVDRARQLTDAGTTALACSDDERSRRGRKRHVRRAVELYVDVQGHLVRTRVIGAHQVRPHPDL
jgi:hypothetical protein